MHDPTYRYKIVTTRDIGTFDKLADAVINEQRMIENHIIEKLDAQPAQAKVTSKGESDKSNEPSGKSASAKTSGKKGKSRYSLLQMARSPNQRFARPRLLSPEIPSTTNPEVKTPSPKRTFGAPSPQIGDHYQDSLDQNTGSLN